MDTFIANDAKDNAMLTYAFEDSNARKKVDVSEY
jgi:hypothetical protein